MGGGKRCEDCIERVSISDSDFVCYCKRTPVLLIKAGSLGVNILAEIPHLFPNLLPISSSFLSAKQ